jgi:WD40 repeat protein
LDYKIRLWDARSGLLFLLLCPPTIIDAVGTCVTTFTGHRDLVTNIDFQKVPLSSSGGEGELFVDAIASVSDDGTVKLFFLDVASFM